MATHSIFLLGKPHGQRSLVGYSLMGSQRVGQDLATKQQTNEIPFLTHFVVVQHTYTMRCCSALKRKKTVICNHMDEHGGH